uniref:Uncharacterized protein n=1 Tax=Bionectria ochroleuca TaxID=29856 RepID=A0A8H7KBN5_BIOOC
MGSETNGRLLMVALNLTNNKQPRIQKPGKKGDTKVKRLGYFWRPGNKQKLDEFLHSLSESREDQESFEQLARTLGYSPDTQQKVSEELKKGNEELKRSNRELQKDNEELQKDNEELKQDNEELKKDNKELQKGNEELKKDNKELQKGNEELQKDNEELKKDNKELQKGNEERQKGNEELKKDNKELKKGNEERQKGNEELEDKIMKLQRGNEELEDKIMKLQKKIEQLQPEKESIAPENKAFNNLTSNSPDCTGLLWPEAAIYPPCDQPEFQMLDVATSNAQPPQTPQPPQSQPLDLFM